MGLLDDAIREHLDLKRRRGADPDEIERLEHEALGPVRRPQADPFDAPSTDDPLGGRGYADDEADEDWPDAPGAPTFTNHGAHLDDDDDFEDWDAAERAPVERDERGPVGGAVDVEPDSPPPRTPAPPRPAEDPPERGTIDEQHYLEQETVEHDVEREELRQTEDDDMLEETPDFLQDTPDHDRLWFEQRPPRDFDLDG